MTTITATWRDCSAYCAIWTETIAKPAFGALDQRTRVIIRPLSREQAEELARARGVDIQTPRTQLESNKSELEGIETAYSTPIVHPSIRHAFLEGLVYAMFGTGLLWAGILGIILAVRGLLG